MGATSSVNTKTPEKRPKPLQVKRGNITVKIYEVENRGGDAVYPRYAVVYYDGTQRRKKRLADLAEAKREWLYPIKGGPNALSRF